MTIRQLDDVDSHLVQSLYIGDLLIRRVDAADELLDASHQLLMRVFDPSVVDPKFVYLDAVTDTSGDIRDYAPQFYAGVFPQGKDEWIAGFVAGDVMRLGAEGLKLQLAIGNIATSPRLREMGFRGVGRTLWQAAVKGAANQAALVNKTLAFSSSEAEPASLPFWSKLGYKWPEGVKYFQPPLEFDEKGIPVHEEVPETLLVYAFDPHASVISVLELKEMIEAMYWNWAVRPSIRRLNGSALQRARAYVMETVLEKTLQTVPKTGNLPLVAVPADKAH